MELEELSASQLFIAGNMMAKISEELKNSLEQNSEKDVEKATKYIFYKFDEINKEIAEEVLKRTIESMKKLQKTLEEI